MHTAQRMQTDGNTKRVAEQQAAPAHGEAQREDEYAAQAVTGKALPDAALLDRVPALGTAPAANSVDAAAPTSGAAKDKPVHMESSNGGGAEKGDSSGADAAAAQEPPVMGKGGKASQQPVGYAARAKSKAHYANGQRETAGCGNKAAAEYAGQGANEPQAPQEIVEAGLQARAAVSAEGQYGKMYRDTVKDKDMDVKKKKRFGKEPPSASGKAAELAAVKAGGGKVPADVIQGGGRKRALADTAVDTRVAAVETAVRDAACGAGEGGVGGGAGCGTSANGDGRLPIKKPRGAVAGTVEEVRVGVLMGPPRTAVTNLLLRCA